MIIGITLSFMRIQASIVLSVFIPLLSFSQTTDSTKNGGLEFYIHEEVTNADGEVEKQLIELWQNYISEGKFEDKESPYWSFENMQVPDENFWAIGINTLNEREYKVQCKIIGVFKVENGHWSLISSFSHVDETGEIHLDVISAVYAKKSMESIYSLAVLSIYSQFLSIGELAILTITSTRSTTSTPRKPGK